MTVSRSSVRIAPVPSGPNRKPSSNIVIDMSPSAMATMALPATRSREGVEMIGCPSPAQPSSASGATRDRAASVRAVVGRMARGTFFEDGSSPGDVLGNCRVKIDHRARRVKAPLPRRHGPKDRDQAGHVWRTGAVNSIARRSRGAGSRAWWRGPCRQDRLVGADAEPLGGLRAALPARCFERGVLPAVCRRRRSGPARDSGRGSGGCAPSWFGVRRASSRRTAAPVDGDRGLAEFVVAYGPASRGRPSRGAGGGGRDDVDGRAHLAVNDREVPLRPGVSRTVGRVSSASRFAKTMSRWCAGRAGGRRRTRELRRPC